MDDQSALGSGILLVGHGTRSRRGTDQLLQLCRQFTRTLSPLPVETAFLELQRPSIEEAAFNLLRRGIDRITVVPLLLFAAGHAKEDIPRAVNEALLKSRAHRRLDVQVSWADHFGCHPALVELSRRRFDQALEGKSPTPEDESCLLLVGRGSHDRQAVAEMYEFARLRQRSTAGMQARVTFLAMAQPLLASELENVAAKGLRRVVVQPHLLFDGELLATIEQEVASARVRWQGTEWLLAPPLADPPGQTANEKELLATELLAKVMWDRYHQAAIHVVANARDS